MLKVKTGLRLGRLLVGSFLVVGLAGPALAGNVYSWVTEDGTYAFTDDSKRIPAKHRNEARQRPMGQLTRYERYTQVDAEQEKPYAERIRARRDQLRAMTTTTPTGVVAGAAVAQSGTGIGYTFPIQGGAGRAGRSGANLYVPVGGASADAADEPTTLESRRMRSPDSRQTTRHWTIIKKGDRIVTVIKGERRQRTLEEALSESDFDI